MLSGLPPFALLLLPATPTRATAVVGDGQLLANLGSPLLICTWNAHFTVEAVQVGDILTLSGLWYLTPDGGRARLTLSTTRLMMKAVVTSRHQPVLTPFDL